MSTWTASDDGADIVSRLVDIGFATFKKRHPEIGDGTSGRLLGRSSRHGNLVIQPSFVLSHSPPPRSPPSRFPAESEEVRQ